MNSKLIIIVFAVCLCLLGGCRKAFLEKSPNRALLVPKTLADFRALMDNSQVMNIAPALSFFSADDFTISDTGYGALVTAIERNGYIWLAKNDLYEGRNINDWSTPYLQVFYANIVLEGLDKLGDEKQTDEYRNIKGTAHFMRAFAYYNLSLLFASPYLEETANTQLGLPMRLSADVNIKSVRGSLYETYQQMVKDLEEALALLPRNTNFKTRPNKAAANLLLAKIYLTMANYQKAGHYAKTAVSLSNGILDYNTLSTSSARPFPIALPNSNVEILFYSSMITYGFLSSAQTGVALELYQSYAANDLRKTLYFRDRGNSIFQFKGNYTGTAAQFAGLSTNEAILIEAECEARVGEITTAMNILNSLLIKRWKTSTFVPTTVSDRKNAVDIILRERRKELIAREVRWFDLRRLNLDPTLAKTLSRKVGLNDYILVPNDVRYTLPIPIQEVMLSGIAQNER